MSEQLARRVSPRPSDPSASKNHARRKSLFSSSASSPLPLAFVASDLEMSDRMRLRRSPRFCATARNSDSGARKANAAPPEGSAAKPPNKKKLRTGSEPSKKKSELEESAFMPFFAGDPVPDDEARRRWPWRYQEQGRQSKNKCLTSNDDDEDELVLNVKCHYYQAEIENCIFNLGDYVYVKGKEGGQNYVGRILEFFKTMDDEDYFRVRWLYRAEDTIMNEDVASHDKRRLFYSDMMNDNLLDCIVSKLKIIQTAPSVNLKSKCIPTCDFYYDMKYSVDYSTFCTMVTDGNNISSSACMKTVLMNGIKPKFEGISSHKPYRSELALLDIYSGCGGMSTGLCLGAKLSGLDLVTRWAIDLNKSACDSLKLNHPGIHVRNESAEDFLHLLKEWDKLCKRFGTKNVEKVTRSNSKISRASQDSNSGEYEVSSLVDICYGDPTNTGKRGLKFKVRWAGYAASEDTWEPAQGLSNCQERIQDFVLKGLKAKILPCPGDAGVVCGGPPCQGISGYNRYRNEDFPLDDERNRQIVVFMDIVNFLKPKYVLMENVVDILRFAKGSLGRYALSRLVHMNYQARLGMMAAGCYGLPQFRLRVFLWGAHPLERLPQFPLPTHDVVLKYGAPSEFERNVVAYDETQSRELEKALVLRDAISDLPPITNEEIREEMSYRAPPETDFQRYIRATKCEMMGSTSGGKIKTQKSRLYDHRPLPLTEDDYVRVCRIPKKKGANYRDLPGVVVGSDNVARRDPAEEILLPSGKPLIPEYALNLWEGKSLRPFARLWWDETVPTVLCRPDPHSQAVLHPEQDRMLTIRENARLQGFPDYYEFCGNIKGRYCQIGNAVAIPVARALGYALGMAVQKLSGDEPLMTLPPKFSHSTTLQLLQSSHEI
ncbi:DNA (cytosine-5)-methyltransferase CMT2-like isoform X2 [Malania oleifera]|uniref:DNA (cytosine-5)-methyltransferase CMT2-like isoform X2 n=1 Tax=Malania oleifera TaxID=397392 RepID=UPI0025AEC327|nr:DNA (cytosine-5)-methyltransferase CMT2-like isoform X2 [Malania oleifera]